MSTAFRRRGDVSMTKKQYAILCELRKAYEAEQPLVALPIRTKWDERSLMLMQRDFDWIVESKKVFPGERRFMITGRGLNALKMIESPSREKAPAGDMCYTCGKNPIYVAPCGKRSSYCRTCHNEMKRAAYAYKGHRYDHKKPCSRCKSRRRAISRTGQVYAYCKICRRQISCETRARTIARLKDQEQLGTLPLCKRCQRSPIHFSKHAVYVYCKGCLAERVRLKRRKQKLQRRLNKFTALRRPVGK